MWPELSKASVRQIVIPGAGHAPSPLMGVLRAFNAQIPCVFVHDVIPFSIMIQRLRLSRFRYAKRHRDGLSGRNARYG